MAKKTNRKPSKRPIKRNRHGQIEKGSGPLNPSGRPGEGESWQATFKAIANLTPADAAALTKEIGARLKKYQTRGALTLKQLVALRVFDALLFEPQASLLNAVMDRAEGKVAQPVAVMNWRDYLEQNGISASAVFERMVAAVADAVGPVRSDDGGSRAGGGGTGTDQD